jgi:hypothetical protein
MAWAVDRLGQSLSDLVDSLKESQGAHVDLFLPQQANAREMRPFRARAF